VAKTGLEGRVEAEKAEVFARLGGEREHHYVRVALEGVDHLRGQVGFEAGPGGGQRPVPDGDGQGSLHPHRRTGRDAAQTSGDERPVPAEMLDGPVGDELVGITGHVGEPIVRGGVRRQAGVDDADHRTSAAAAEIGRHAGEGAGLPREFRFGGRAGMACDHEEVVRPGHADTELGVDLFQDRGHPGLLVPARPDQACDSLDDRDHARPPAPSGVDDLGRFARLGAQSDLVQHLLHGADVLLAH